MTIKIEDLPEGRQVKKITFDILFEDGEFVDIQNITKKETTKVDSQTKPVHVFEDNGLVDIPTTAGTNESPNIQAQSVDTKRPENVAFDMDMEL